MRNFSAVSEGIEELCRNYSSLGQDANLDIPADYLRFRIFNKDQ
jgi:hypothetical protein